MRTSTLFLIPSLPLLGCIFHLATAGEAFAQSAEPPFGTLPQSPFQGGAGATGQPGAGQPGATGQPGAPQPGATGQPGAAGQPGPGQPAPGTFGGGANAQFGAGGMQAGGGAQGQFQQPGQLSLGAPPPGATDDEAEWKARNLALNDQNSLSGGTGLLRTSYAGGGVQGQFRVGFVFDWFTSSGFLCDPADSTPAGVPITCSGKNTEDSASRVGGFFSLSATPFSFLEAYASLRTYANSNDQGSPQLLQVLGDTTIGVKGYTPKKLLGPIQAGGEVQLLLLNGTGDVGLTGGATSARFKINGTFDARDINEDIPFRTNLNLGYKVDNSAAAVDAVEIARAKEFNDGRDRQPISRIERFGLGINKVDFFEIGLGVEVPFSFIQPFVEWSLDIPVNRQGYQCYTNRVSRGDVCLGLEDLSDPNGSAPGFSIVPSRFGLGTRVTPFQAIKGAEAFRGLSALVGFEIGTSGTSQFVEEVAPQAPWTLYLGLGFAYDAKPRPPKVVQTAAPTPVQVPAPQSYVRGFVHEKGKQEGVPNAIISFQGGAQPPVATGADGRFLTRNVEPGSYTFDVNVTGYKPGTCTAMVAPPVAAQPQMMPGQQPGQPFGGPGFPQMPQPMPQNPQPQGPSFTDVDCELESLPRTGNIVGTVKDSAGANVGGAVVTITDALGKDTKVTADGSGNFKTENLPPGEVTLKVDATGFMRHVSTAEVRANEDAKTTLTLNKRPKNALVKIQGNEIKLSDKILFETDSAKILGQSSALLEEVAEVLQKNTNIQQVEIQGHTDNTGGRDHNQKLSEARANAVKDWLVKAGVSGSRMTAKGYGQDRPLAPNVTEANRTKNRRVQFIILKK